MHQREKEGYTNRETLFFPKELRVPQGRYVSEHMIILQCDKGHKIHMQEKRVNTEECGLVRECF